MTVAFVLINTEIDAMEKVLHALNNVDEVAEAYSLYGTFDIIAKIQAENVEKLKEIIYDKIRKLEDVRSTLTTIVVEKM